MGTIKGVEDMTRAGEHQVPTELTPLAAIMSSREFARGLDDVRNGVPFDWRNGDWSYERGRLFGHIAPLNMPLKIGGKLNPKALALCRAAFKRRLLT